jgi:hypothetical protein
MMYRRGLLDSLLTGEDRFIDFRIYVELAAHGPLGFLQQVLGTYTVGVGISKSNRWLPEIMAAIRSAEGRGVASETLRLAEANHLFRASLNAFYAGDDGEFQRLVYESRQRAATSSVQGLFYQLRRRPGMLRRFDQAYKRLRRRGLLRDMKMRFR